jgi:diketogulonate reductase-like aldo/keto reductase
MPTVDHMNKLTLNNDIEIRALGLGVFQTLPDETRDAVTAALATGYRHIDTAAAYGNERKDPVIGQIAQARGKTPAQVMLRWHGQQGRSVIPKATKPHHIAENFEVFDFDLGDDQLTAIDSLDTESAAALSRPTSCWRASVCRSLSPDPSTLTRRADLTPGGSTNSTTRKHKAG